MASSAGFQLVAGRIPGESVEDFVSSSNSPESTGSEVEAHAVTAPVVSGRVYAITVDVAVRSDTDGDDATVRIREDSLTGDQIQRRSYHIPDASHDYGAHFVGRYVADATEDKTFSITIERASGSGTVETAAAGDRLALVYVNYVEG